MDRVCSIVFLVVLIDFCCPIKNEIEPTRVLDGEVTDKQEQRLFTFGRNNLMFFDPDTNQNLMPPVVTPLGYAAVKAPAGASEGRPCTCNDDTCTCCAGMNMNVVNFKQKLCTKFKFSIEQLEVGMEVSANDKPIYQNKFEARNPPLLCVPVPLPFFPISVDVCMMIYDVNLEGGRLHMCLDMMARIQQAPILVLHFDCMEMGAGGLMFVKPNGITPVIPAIESPEISTEDAMPTEIVSTPTAGINPTQVINPTQIATDQTDFDVYDEITEIKYRKATKMFNGTEV